MPDLERLGRYRIRAELGRGGMGVVYRAWDPSLRREVAVKTLPPQLAGDATMRARFASEARNAGSLHHNNILPVFDVGERGGRVYLVMPLVEGRDLATLLAERGRLTLAEARPLLHQVAAAVDYAHERGLVHRDLKPANVMVQDDGHVLLTDFGIARALAEAGCTLTRTGEVIGTPDYMSPEQAAGKPLDHRSDLYSLGVLAYRTLTGALPFRADNVYSAALQVVTEPPLDPRTWVPTLAPQTAAALLRMLAKQPEGRFETARAFVAELVDGAPEPAPPPPPRVGSRAPASPASKPRRPALAQLEYPCPRCREPLVVDGAKAGQSYICPLCGAVTIVPVPAAGPATPLPAPAPRASGAQLGQRTRVAIARLRTRLLTDWPAGGERPAGAAPPRRNRDLGVMAFAAIAVLLLGAVFVVGRLSRPVAAPAPVSERRSWPQLRHTAMTPAQERAQSRCQGNLAEIGRALLQYASDYDDRLPAVSRQTDHLGQGLTIALAPYLRNPAAWSCPLALGGSALYPGSQRSYLHPDFATRPSLGLYANPATEAVMADGEWGRVAWRHTGSANFLFLDGHVLGCLPVKANPQWEQGLTPTPPPTAGGR